MMHSYYKWRERRRNPHSAERRNIRNMILSFVFLGLGIGFVERYLQPGPQYPVGWAPQEKDIPVAVNNNDSTDTVNTMHIIAMNADSITTDPVIVAYTDTYAEPDEPVVEIIDPDNTVVDDTAEVEVEIEPIPEEIAEGQTINTAPQFIVVSDNETCPTAESITDNFDETRQDISSITPDDMADDLVAMNAPPGLSDWQMLAYRLSLTP